MAECLGTLCDTIGRCLACVFCDCLWCECNCIIFPAPCSPYFLQGHQGQGQVQSSFHNFTTSHSKVIPYAQISTARSRLSKKCFIYFHGNAEDIGLVGIFLQPLVEQLNVTFYSIEYPTYSSYHSCCPAFISDTIKQDALQFYDYLLRTGKTAGDVYAMGRSIGSGGASYLAGHRNVPLLVLMSPFDSIRQVAIKMVGCLGCLIKQHFDNEQELVNFTGDLLVIHGQADEVIAVQHGKKLVRTYQMGNAYKNLATKEYPRHMTHNTFDLEDNIILPIANFLKR